MENKQNRYKLMERNMSLVLLADLALFISCLIAAGNGIIWLKVILSILTILLSALCLIFLHLSGELGKQRSLWMSTAAAAITVCVLFSLILNFPSPSPYQHTEANNISSDAES